MVPITLTNIAILAAAATILVLLQPTLLGASASMCGEKKGGWGLRLAAILVAGLSATLGQVLYGLTLGLVLSRLGTVPVAMGALAVNFAVTSVVYSAFLRISVSRAAAVAGIYWVFSLGLAGAIGLALKLFLG